MYTFISNTKIFLSPECLYVIIWTYKVEECSSNGCNSTSCLLFSPMFHVTTWYTLLQSVYNQLSVVSYYSRPLSITFLFSLDIIVLKWLVSIKGPIRSHQFGLSRVVKTTHFFCLKPDTFSVQSIFNSSFVFSLKNLSRSLTSQQRNLRWDS